MARIIAWRLIPKKLFLKDREYDIFMTLAQVAFIVHMYAIGAPWQILVIVAGFLLHTLYLFIKDFQTDLVYIAAMFIVFTHENPDAPYEKVRDMVVEDFRQVAAMKAAKAGRIRNIFVGAVIIMTLLVIVLDFIPR